MGYCFLNQTGGAPLNFKVVGGTAQPTNPGENTIWVNTEAEITGWVFSAKEPALPSSGMVWFATGADSGVEFNALKKNALVVGPVKASQYLGGEWVSKDAHIYRQNAWELLSYSTFYLFNYGDVPGNSGGLTISEKSYIGGGFGNLAPTVTVNSDGSWTLKMSANSGSGCIHTGAIDLTDFQKVCFRGSIPYSYSNYCSMGVLSTLDGSLSNNRVAQAGQTTDGYVELDISALTGNHYLAVGLASSGIVITIEQWWLE